MLQPHQSLAQVLTNITTRLSTMRVHKAGVQKIRLKTQWPVGWFDLPSHVGCQFCALWPGQNMISFAVEL